MENVNEKALDEFMESGRQTALDILFEHEMRISEPELSLTLREMKVKNITCYVINVHEEKY